MLSAALELQGLDPKKLMYQLEVADQAGQRLEEILSRCTELAQEAAKESTPLARRVVLQAEADKLVEEYNTIVKETDFTITKRIEQALNKANN